MKRYTHGCEIPFTEHFTHSETQVGLDTQLLDGSQSRSFQQNTQFLFTRCLQSKRINIAMKD